MINVSHDDRHSGSISSGAFNLFHNAQLEKAAVEDSGQTIQVSQLFYALNIVGILNSRGADVSHRLQGLQVRLDERIYLGTVEREYTQHLSERDERYRHTRGRFLEKLRGLRSAAQVTFSDAGASGQDARPGIGASQKAATL